LEPSLKFVSAIKDAFSDKKNGGQVFIEKIPNRGVRGGLAKDHTFSGFFFATFPYPSYNPCKSQVWIKHFQLEFAGTFILSTSIREHP